VDREGPDQKRGRDIAGNAQSEERDQRRRDDGVVGRFGGGDALGALALAELLGRSSTPSLAMP
jgi:hypothetical protein